MAVGADYGETLLTEEERDALTPAALDVLGDPIREADLYDLEQQIQAQVADEFLARVVTGSPSVSELLTDHFVRELHKRLFGPVWGWGGRHRARETIADGNGRVTRLLADLVFLAAQDDEPVLGYDWEIDRRTYVRLLGEYDVTRDPTPLVEFIPIIEVTEEASPP